MNRAIQSDMVMLPPDASSACFATERLQTGMNFHRDRIAHCPNPGPSHDVVWKEGKMPRLVEVLDDGERLAQNNAIDIGNRDQPLRVALSMLVTSLFAGQEVDGHRVKWNASEIECDPDPIGRG